MADLQQELTCTYDPLKEFLAHYADAKATRSESGSRADLPIEEKLKQRIIDGDRLGMEDDLKFALGLSDGFPEEGTRYPALTIINDILDFSKIEAGKMDLSYIEFDLEQVVDDVCELMAGPAHAKGLELVAFVHKNTQVALWLS